MSFGKVFDLPHLRKSLGRTILEWEDVKDEESTEYDEIGCWGVWQASQHRDPHPRFSKQIEMLKLGELIVRGLFL
jgi:hypothetical protein